MDLWLRQSLRTDLRGLQDAEANAEAQRALVSRDGAAERRGVKRTMSLGSLIGLGFTVSIFFGVLAVGMRVVPADLRYLRDKPSQLIRSLLAMNVLAPIAAVVVCKTF